MEETFTVLKSFNNSEQKKVVLIMRGGDKCILRHYSDIKEVELEKLLMSKVACTGYAPTIVDSNSDYIIYKFIEGETFAEKFRQATMSDDKDLMLNLAKKLCIFMQMFHSIADGYIFGDIDFNDFILNDDRCIGLDFHLARLGMPNEDVAGIIAYALCNAVGNVHSCFPFVFKVLECYHIKLIDIINELSNCLERKQKQVNLIDRDLVMDMLMSYEENGKVWQYINSI